MSFVLYILKTVKIMLQNVNFTADLQNQLNDFINSYFLHIFMKMDHFPFPDTHVKKENMSAVLVPSFCHPIIKADLLNLVRFQTCNSDSEVLSDALSELRLIKQTKVFFIYSQTENVSNETIHIPVSLKMYICINDS